MPQATDEQRAAWGGEQGVGEDKACNYLETAGFKLTRQWNWLIPKGHMITEQEAYAAQFLVDEWDWGWFVTKLGDNDSLSATAGRL